MQVRPAKMKDVRRMQRLVNSYAEEEKMLARSLSEMYEHVRDFFVVEDAGGGLAGCGALTVSWEDLGEIRSVAVARGEIGNGLGSEIVRACLDEARRLEIVRVFVLTYIPGYFGRFGFHEVGREELPHKIWAECIKCPKFPECGEVPMVLDLSG